MTWLLLTLGFLGFSILTLRTPVERQLDKWHERKLVKAQASKEIKMLKAKVEELEELNADKVILNHKR